MACDRDAEDPELIERLLAALYRDGFAVLEAGISDPAACDATLSAMQPYLERAAERQAGGEVRAGAVLARTEASWGLVAHPTVMTVAEAVVGRQTLNGGIGSVEEQMLTHWITCAWPTHFTSELLRRVAVVQLPYLPSDTAGASPR